LIRHWRGDSDGVVCIDGFSVRAVTDAGAPISYDRAKRVVRIGYRIANKTALKVKLLEINTASGEVTVKRVLEYSALFGRTHFVVDVPYTRGERIQHFLVDEGDVIRIDVRIECPDKPPYIAIASRS
jgi:hypothetical protein